MAESRYTEHLNQTMWALIIVILLYLNMSKASYRDNYIMKPNSHGCGRHPMTKVMSALKGHGITSKNLQENFLQKYTMTTTIKAVTLFTIIAAYCNLTCHARNANAAQNDNGIDQLLHRLRDAQEKLRSHHHSHRHSRHGYGKELHEGSDSRKAKALCHARSLQKCGTIITDKIENDDTLTREEKCGIRQLFVRCMIKSKRTACENLSADEFDPDQVERLKKSVAEMMFSLRGCIPGV
ncbi:hypothetical protein QYM36_017346 [Artemia franciscana]|uniref:Uncharacterized protein n=1 Tax=Artemia franciscana TaxID=6661 RepID=A0AA88KWX8_ARTSF|nr:hypothetical protein QYM36_017346 [Artemia franciscana]